MMSIKLSFLRWDYFWVVVRGGSEGFNAKIPPRFTKTEIPSITRRINLIKNRAHIRNSISERNNPKG